MSADRQFVSFVAPPRLLMGPGPSGVDPRVLAAMARSPLGHLDPSFTALMTEVAMMLRQVFRTRHDLTLAISGTGTAGMQAAMANVVEEGDAVVVGVGTAIADDPQLTVRHAEGKQPVRVVIDPSGRLPPASCCLRDDGVVSDEVMRKLQEELDLEETRLPSFDSASAK